MTEDKQAELFQSLGRLEEGMKQIQKIVPVVEKHEQYVKTAKVLGIPALVVFHASMKHLLAKIGL